MHNVNRKNSDSSTEALENGNNHKANLEHSDNSKEALEHENIPKVNLGDNNSSTASLELGNIHTVNLEDNDCNTASLDPGNIHNVNLEDNDSSTISAELGNTHKVNRRDNESDQISVQCDEGSPNKTDCGQIYSPIKGENGDQPSNLNKAKTQVFSFVATPLSSPHGSRKTERNKRSRYIDWNLQKYINMFNRRLNSKTKISSETTPCTEHNDMLKYWCSTCKKAKCEKCVNIVYNKSCVNHTVTTLKDYVAMREKDDKELIQHKSSVCLKATDGALKVLQEDFHLAELSALIQEERIKQEFISFHALLIDEERKILENLRQCFEEYKDENCKRQGRCGDIIAKQAEVSFQNVEDREHDLLRRIENMNKSMEKWSVLERKTEKLMKTGLSIPSKLQNKFTLFQEKTYIQKHLSTFSDLIELSALNFTVFLSGSTIDSPLNVTDLFECKNTKYAFNNLEVDLEICQNRQVLQYHRTRMNGIVCNGNGKIRLMENSKYVVRGRLVVDGISSLRQNVCKNTRNVLIVTGLREDLNRTSIQSDIKLHIEIVRRVNRHKCIRTYSRDAEDDDARQIFKVWKDCGMWLFSSTRDCKEFFDVSPEELRVLAYYVDKAEYVSTVDFLQQDFLNLCGHFERSHIHFPFKCSNMHFFLILDMLIDSTMSVKKK